MIDHLLWSVEEGQLYFRSALVWRQLQFVVITVTAVRRDTADASERLSYKNLSARFQ